MQRARKNHGTNTDGNDIITILSTSPFSETPFMAIRAIEGRRLYVDAYQLSFFQGGIILSMWI